MHESISISIFNKRLSVKIIFFLVLLIVVGAFIRFYKLTAPGLWLDELFSMNGADPNTSFREVYEYSKGDQPPLFFFLLHFWLKISGYTDFAGRALTVIFGLMGIPAIYVLGKELKNARVGLVAAMLTTLNWFHADMSREIRFYPLVFLLTTLSFLFFLRSIKNLRGLDFILYSIFTALLLNTHYYALVVLASQFTIFFVIVIFYKRDGRLITGGIIAGMMAGLSLVHWMSIILKDIQTDQFHVQSVPFYFPFTFAWIYLKDPAAILVYVLCFFLMVKYLKLKVKSKEIPMEDTILIGWICIGFLIPLLYSWIKIPMLTAKYSTITLPGILLFVACGFSLIKKEKIKFYMVIALVVGAFIAMFISRPLNKPRRAEDWREVANYFSSNQANPQTIFAQLAYFHIFYFKHFGYSQELPFDQRYSDFEGIVKKSERIWLLMHPRYPDAGFTPTQQQLVDSEFELKEQVQFKETKGFLYERK